MQNKATKINLHSDAFKDGSLVHGPSKTPFVTYISEKILFAALSFRYIKLSSL